MKRVNKQEPDFYKEFVRKKNPANWNETKDISFALREYMLMKEQNFQCAYTEKNISANSHSSHIDHFCKQSMFQDKKFIYNNLFTCCNNESFGAKFKDKNIQMVDYKLLLNPLTDNYDRYFEYTLDGYILPLKNNLKAEKTIELFNLNHKILIEKRSSVINQTLAYGNQIELQEIIEYLREFESFIIFVYEYSNK